MLIFVVSEWPRYLGFDDSDVIVANLVSWLFRLLGTTLFDFDSQRTHCFNTSSSTCWILIWSAEMEKVTIPQVDSQVKRSQGLDCSPSQRFTRCGKECRQTWSTISGREGWTVAQLKMWDFCWPQKSSATRNQAKISLRYGQEFQVREKSHRFTFAPRHRKFDGCFYVNLRMGCFFLSFFSKADCAGWCRTAGCLWTFNAPKARDGGYGFRKHKSTPHLHAAETPSALQKCRLSTDQANSSKNGRQKGKMQSLAAFHDVLKIGQSPLPKLIEHTYSTCLPKEVRSCGSKLLEALGKLAKGC